MKTMIRYKW